MRVLFTTQPIRAHVLPMMPIAHALAHAGHEVVFACADGFRAAIEGLGHRAVAAGLDWTDITVDRSFPDLARMSAHDKRTWYMTGLFAGLAAHRSVPDLFRICRDWQPAVLIRNDFEFAAPIVAEKLDVPCGTIGVDLGLPATHLASVVGRPLAYLRAANGLPADRSGEMLSPHFYLSLIPRSCQFREFVSTTTVHFVRPRDEKPPAHDDGRGVSVIHVSVESGEEALVESLRRFSFDVVRGIGDTWSATDIMLTDGRFGDVAIAIARGLPMLLSPAPTTRGFHFPRWEALGVARICPREALTAERLTTELGALADDPGYRTNAVRLGRESLTLDGPDGAVTLFERFASDAGERRRACPPKLASNSRERRRAS